MAKNAVIIVFTILLLLISGIGFSQTVGREEAGFYAKSFFGNKLAQAGKNREMLTIASFDSQSIDGKTLYYIINFKEGGFVILSADKRIYPVLAYDFMGSFDQDKIPENCKSWTSVWESQIKNALLNEGHYFSSDVDVWDNLLYGKYTDSGSKGIAPLLTCTWSQMAPHNQMCPADLEGYDGHTPVGCVALAMSQLMYYYRFPDFGSGTVLYTPAYQFGIYGPQYVNFAEAIYKWPAMTDICRETNDAIAQLCYHAGVSVETAYMPESSGANINNVSAALSGHFNYLADDYLERNAVPNTAAWAALLIQNLENNQPVLYRSSSGFGGHVYVCDGYQDSTHFHFNWGWGGAYNGYFYIDNLTPGGIQINYAQGAIFNIYPDTSQFEYPDLNTETEILSNNVGSFEDGSGNLSYPPSIQKAWLIQPDDPEITNIALEFTFVETQAGHDIISVFDGSSNQAPLLASLSGDDFPVAFNASGPALFVSFSSDAEIQGRGFHANYYGYHLPFCDAETVLTGRTGLLEDGSRYHQYMDNSDCEWLIAPEISPLDSVARVSLHFYQLQLAGGDTLYIYDGENGQSPLLGKIAAGNLPDDFIATGNKMFLHFKTDSTFTDQGWAVGWESLLPEYCRDTLVFVAPDDTLSDGSGKKNYTENSDCYFLIQPPNAEQISITFSDLALEPNYDFIEFFNPENLNNPLDKFSGFGLPPEKTYPFSQLLVHFHSDFRDNYQGWKFSYQAAISAIAENSEVFSIYPNPVSGVLHIGCQHQESSNGTYRIYSPEGIELLSGQLEQEDTGINLGKLKPGIYLCFIQIHQHTFTKKIMKF